MTRRAISLALRLTVSIGAVITLTLLILGWLVEHSIDIHFVQQDVDELNAVLHAVSQALDDPMLAETNEDLKRRLASVIAGHHNAQFQLTDAHGRLIYTTSYSALNNFAQRTAFAEVIDIESVSTWQEHGQTYRGAVLQLIPSTTLYDTPLTLAVATDIDFHLRYLESFRVYLKLITLAACVFAISATWFVVYQGHAPLRRISADIRRIKSNHLSIRLASDTVPVELTELAVSFNDMLDRLEEGFQRLSNFSADIAHELRTPITNLRTQTEVALSQARDLEQYQEVLYSNLEEYERMSKMISDMLFLAQTDNQQLQTIPVTINLLTEVQMLFEYFEAWAEECSVTLLHAGPALSVQGDKLMIRRALSNLLSNAIRYTPAGQAVTVSLAVNNNGTVLIRVANPCLNLNPEQLTKLFDRFYRADPSRQRKGDGAGLGLAIVKSIIELHGGSINAKVIDQQMVFEIQLDQHPKEP